MTMNISSSWTTTDTGSSAVAIPALGVFSVSFGGGTGTVKIERSRDGSIWYDVSKDQDGNAASYAITGGEIALDLLQADKKMQWRLTCTVHSVSSTITYQMSQ